MTCNRRKARNALDGLPALNYATHCLGDLLKCVTYLDVRCHTGPSYSNRCCTGLYWGLGGSGPLKAVGPGPKVNAVRAVYCGLCA